MIDSAEKDLNRRIEDLSSRSVFTEGSAIGQEYQALEDEMVASRPERFKYFFLIVAAELVQLQIKIIR